MAKTTISKVKKNDKYRKSICKSCHALLKELLEFNKKKFNSAKGKR